MPEMIVLDAVSVATIARAARDAAAALASRSGPADSALSMLHDPVSAILRRMHRSRNHVPDPPVDALSRYAADDVETVRELALFRGRISGAHAMQRHYTQERAALADRHDGADAACAAELAAP